MVLFGLVGLIYLNLVRLRMVCIWTMEGQEIKKEERKKPKWDIEVLRNRKISISLLFQLCEKASANARVA